MYDINIDVDVVAYEGFQNYRRRGTMLNTFFYYWSICSGCG